MRSAVAFNRFHVYESSHITTPLRSVPNDRAYIPLSGSCRWTMWIACLSLAASVRANYPFYSTCPFRSKLSEGSNCVPGVDTDATNRGHSVCTRYESTAFSTWVAYPMYIQTNLFETDTGDVPYNASRMDFLGTYQNRTMSSIVTSEVNEFPQMDAAYVLAVPTIVSSPSTVGTMDDNQGHIGNKLLWQLSQNIGSQRTLFYSRLNTLPIVDAICTSDDMALENDISETFGGLYDPLTSTTGYYGNKTGLWWWRLGGLVASATNPADNTSRVLPAVNTQNFKYDITDDVTSYDHVYCLAIRTPDQNALQGFEYAGNVLRPYMHSNIIVADSLTQDEQAAIHSAIDDGMYFDDQTLALHVIDASLLSALLVDYFETSEYHVDLHSHLKPYSQHVDDIVNTNGPAEFPTVGLCGVVKSAFTTVLAINYHDTFYGCGVNQKGTYELSAGAFDDSNVQMMLNTHILLYMHRRTWAASGLGFEGAMKMFEEFTPYYGSTFGKVLTEFSRISSLASDLHNDNGITVNTPVRASHVFFESNYFNDDAQTVFGRSNVLATHFSCMPWDRTDNSADIPVFFTAVPYDEQLEKDLSMCGNDDTCTIDTTDQGYFQDDTTSPINLVQDTNNPNALAGCWVSWYGIPLGSGYVTGIVREEGTSASAIVCHLPYWGSTCTVSASGATKLKDLWVPLPHPAHSYGLTTAKLLSHGNSFEAITTDPLDGTDVERTWGDGLLRRTIFTHCRSNNMAAVPSYVGLNCQHSHDQCPDIGGDTNLGWGPDSDIIYTDGIHLFTAQDTGETRTRIVTPRPRTLTNAPFVCRPGKFVESTLDPSSNQLNLWTNENLEVRQWQVHMQTLDAISYPYFPTSPTVPSGILSCMVRPASNTAYDNTALEDEDTLEYLYNGQAEALRATIGLSLVSKRISSESYTEVPYYSLEKTNGCTNNNNPWFVCNASTPTNAVMKVYDETSSTEVCTVTSNAFYNNPQVPYINTSEQGHCTFNNNPVDICSALTDITANPNIAMEKVVECSKCKLCAALLIGDGTLGSTSLIPLVGDPTRPTDIGGTDNNYTAAIRLVNQYRTRGVYVSTKWAGCTLTGGSIADPVFSSVNYYMDHTMDTLMDESNETLRALNVLPSFENYSWRRQGHSSGLSPPVTTTTTASTTAADLTTGTTNAPSTKSKKKSKEKLHGAALVGLIVCGSVLGITLVYLIVRLILHQRRRTSFVDATNEPLITTETAFIF